VVSLVPSVTETLVGWGSPPIACTRFCEQPDLPHVGGTKDPDIAAIAALEPDVVVMCVEENRREDAHALHQAGIATAALSVDGLDDVPVAMRLLGQVAQVEPAGMVDNLVAAIAAARAELTDRSALSAFVPIWKRPWMTLSAGTYGSALLDALGVRNVFADSEERYPETTLEEAAARRPDVVLAPSEPYPFAERHIPLLEEVAPVVLVDGQDLFWWGGRTPDALRRLANQLSTVGG
jgi:ABC-type Fe3+-hydroxamate transport system substrate-binding protein